MNSRRTSSPIAHLTQGLSFNQRLAIAIFFPVRGLLALWLASLIRRHRQ